MADLIDRQAAINEVDLHVGILYDSPTLVESLKTLVKALPSVDAVPVVRCKDCKFSDWYTAVNGGQFCYCSEHDSSGHQEDDYCSLGERKDGDNHEG